jgi:hypothetical protein
MTAHGCAQALQVSDQQPDALWSPVGKLLQVDACAEAGSAAGEDYSAHVGIC